MLLSGVKPPSLKVFMPRFLVSLAAFVSAPNWILPALFVCALVAHSAARADERALQGNGSPWVLALQGDRQAAETLAIRSIQSDGDTTKWVFWTLISAENGTRAAQARYAWMLLHGLTPSVQGLPVAETKFRAVFWACQATTSTPRAKALLANFGADPELLDFDRCASRQFIFTDRIIIQSALHHTIAPMVGPTDIPQLEKEAALGNYYAAEVLAHYHLFGQDKSNALMSYWFSVQAQDKNLPGAYNYGKILSENGSCKAVRGRFWLKKAASFPEIKTVLDPSPAPLSCSSSDSVYGMPTNNDQPPNGSGRYDYFPFYAMPPLFITDPNMPPFSL